MAFNLKFIYVCAAILCLSIVPSGHAKEEPTTIGRRIAMNSNGGSKRKLTKSNESKTKSFKSKTKSPKKSKSQKKVKSPKVPTPSPTIYTGSLVDDESFTFSKANGNAVKCRWLNLGDVENRKTKFCDLENVKGNCTRSCRFYGTKTVEEIGGVSRQETSAATLHLSISLTSYLGTFFAFLFIGELF